MSTTATPWPDSSSETIAVADGLPEPESADAGRGLLLAAAELLEQGNRFLEGVPPEVYARRLPLAFDASIGGHFRHCLDHFRSILAVRHGGVLDYDRRERDLRLEVEARRALAMGRQLRDEVLGCEPGALQRPILVGAGLRYGAGSPLWTRSTLAREMAYGIAHGIHHFALVAVMARLQGMEVAPEFGIAPSTLAHWAAEGRA